MRLARKIIVLLLALFLGLVATLGYVEARRAVRDYHTLVASELAITGRALRAPLAEVMHVEGGEAAQRLLERADADIAHITLRWVPRGAALGDATWASLARNQEVTIEDHAAKTIYVYVPVTSAGGAIELSQSLSQERAVVLAIARERLTVAFAAVLGAALLSILVGVRVVGRPMRALADHARRIAGGDLGHRLSLGGDDEIGELAEEMNVMCEKLELAQKSIAAEADAKLKAMDQLRHADRLKTVGTLASGMAHELGTPLGIIAGRAKMIAAGGTPEQNASYAQVIGAQVERMTKIMRGLLDFARRTPAQKSRTDLRDLARRILDLLAPLAKKNAVTLELAGEGDVYADVDPVQVEQALANLVVNGVQAIDHGGHVTASVDRVKAKAPDGRAERDWVRVAVCDSGQGIRPDDLPHVFEPFFTTKDVGEGTGLGLSVTYGIVQEHEGFALVTSEAGQGSCFELYFPCGVSS